MIELREPVNFDPPSRSTIVATHLEFIEKSEIMAEYCIRPKVLPFLDHHVFRDWITEKEKSLTIFLAEAPLWSYSEENGGPYFYSKEYNPSRDTDMTRILLDSLNIHGPTKIDRLTTFRDEGYLLLDSIKCPIRVKILGRKHVRAFLYESGRSLLIKELKHLQARKGIRCIVTLGGSSRFALGAGVKCTGLPKKRMKKWIEAFDRDKFTFCQASLASLKVAPVLPWVFPGRWNRTDGVDGYFADCRLKHAIEKYTNKWDEMATE
jgi:hypothetical protein